MKRIIVLLMMLILSVALVGCNNSNHGDKKEYLDKNNTDIQQIIKISLDKGEAMSYYFSDKIDYVKNNNYTFFIADLNSNKSSIICGYIEEDKYVPKRHRDVTYMESITWIKFNTIEDIKKNIDGLTFSDCFLVYDVNIEKDLVNGIEYNQSIKYYRDITNDIEWKFYNNKLFTDKMYSKKILLWWPKKAIETDNVFINDNDIKHSYELLDESDMEKYVVFDNQITYSYKDQKGYIYILEKELGVFYELLCKKVIDCSNLNEKVINYNGSYYIVEKIKIDLQEIINLI